MPEGPVPAPGEKYHTSPKEVYAIWLDLRGRAPLAAIAEMLRQDLDGDLLTTVREDGQSLLYEAAELMDRVRALVRAAQGHIPYEDPRQG